MRTGREYEECLLQIWYKDLFQGKMTIRDMLVKPKYKDPVEKKSGAIYWFQYGELACDEEYIGETSWIFGERYKECLKEPSPIHAESIQTGHSTNSENFSIIGRQDHGLARTIKESIYIRDNNPTLNRKVGKYNPRMDCTICSSQ